MMVTKKLDAFGKKMDFGPKNCIFGPKFCIFLRYTYETPIFSAQTATYRKTEGIQSYLRIWGTYDPNEAGQSEPKKWGFIGVA